MEKPKVSVVMIVYDQRKDWLMEALDSLCAQTVRNKMEIILSGVKGDKCLEWGRPFADKVVDGHFPDCKVQINNGIKFADGEYVLVVASDDYFFPKCVEWMLETAEKRSSVISYGDYYYCDPGLNVVLTEKLPREFNPIMLRRYQTITDCALVKKSVLWEFGLYDPKWKKFAMWDMWIKIAEKYPLNIHHCGHVLIKYRRHENSLASQSFMGELDVTGEGLRNEFYDLYNIERQGGTVYRGNYAEKIYPT